MYFIVQLNEMRDILMLLNVKGKYKKRININIVFDLLIREDFLDNIFKSDETYNVQFKNVSVKIKSLIDTKLL